MELFEDLLLLVGERRVYNPEVAVHVIATAVVHVAEPVHRLLEVPHESDRVLQARGVLSREVPADGPGLDAAVPRDLRLRLLALREKEAELSREAVLLVHLPGVIGYLRAVLHGPLPLCNAPPGRPGAKSARHSPQIIPSSCSRTIQACVPVKIPQRSAKTAKPPGDFRSRVSDCSLYQALDVADLIFAQ